MTVEEQDARRLMKALVEGKVNIEEPMTHGWVLEIAAPEGLQDDALTKALAFAGDNGWISDGPLFGTIILNQSGWDNGNA